MIADITFDKGNNLAHSLQLLAEKGPEVTLLAGGTDVMAWLHAGGFEPKRIIDIWSIRPECAAIVEEDDAVSVGALATFSEIIAADSIQNWFPAFAKGCGEIGATQIQNRGTLGGNIGGSSPAGDTLPLLLAYDAEIVVESVRGARSIPYESYCMGYRSTALQHDEMITGVRLPKPPPGSFHFWKKVGTRAAQSISKVMVAGVGRLVDDKVVALRIGVGSVAPVPLLLSSVSDLVQGHALDDKLIAQARLTAEAEISPIDDVRSTADYRRIVAGNLVVRFLEELAGATEET